MVETYLIDKVKMAMLGMQRASWEQGVAAQALLELNSSDIPTTIVLASLAHDAVVRQDEAGRLGVLLNQDDPGCLDPASMVEPLLALSVTVDKPYKDIFSAAAQKMINYLTGPNVLRTEDGVLSHRIDKIQLWVDGIYMGPPALAYAGYRWSDESLTRAAIDQIEGYRNKLWNTEKKLFHHIWDHATLSFESEAFWGVGNGWALAGMIRVLRLLPKKMVMEKNMLLDYVKQCLDGILLHMRPDGLFHNILDDTSSFVETNVAQQVSYTIFRLAQMGLASDEYLEAACRARNAAISKVDQLGLVRGVCGSPYFESSGTAAEGQAFFLLMEAAYRDWLHTSQVQI